MVTLSVPLNSELTSFVDAMVSEKRAENKASVVRMALTWFQEHMLMQELLEAEQDLQEGKVFRGDIRKLVGKM